MNLQSLAHWWYSIELLCPPRGKWACPLDELTAALSGRIHETDKKMLSWMTHTSLKALIHMTPVLLRITLTVKLHRSKSHLSYMKATEAMLENSKSSPADLVWHSISNTEWVIIKHGLLIMLFDAMIRGMKVPLQTSCAPQSSSSARMSLCFVLSARNTWQMGRC